MVVFSHGAYAAPERYRRLTVLGEGGSGRVWLVEDQLRPGSRLALKEAESDRPRQLVVGGRRRRPRRRP